MHRGHVVTWSRGQNPDSAAPIVHCWHFNCGDCCFIRMPMMMLLKNYVVPVDCCALLMNG